MSAFGITVQCPLEPNAIKETVSMEIMYDNQVTKIDLEVYATVCNVSPSDRIDVLWSEVISIYGILHRFLKVPIPLAYILPEYLKEHSDKVCAMIQDLKDAANRFDTGYLI